MRREEDSEVNPNESSTRTRKSNKVRTLSPKGDVSPSELGSDNELSGQFQEIIRRLVARTPPIEAGTPCDSEGHNLAAFHINKIYLVRQP